MSLQIFQMLDMINKRLTNIEKNIGRIDEKLDYSIALQRNHLIRVKNNQDIDDNMILMGKPYNDLTPKRAFEIFNNPNMDFMVLDCTKSNFDSSKRLEGAVHIPLEELSTRILEIQNKTTPILIISEVGLRSIQACEIMVKNGFFNVNNVSGGYEFWPSASKDSNKAQNQGQGL